jgi:hypothetical protein
MYHFEIYNGQSKSTQLPLAHRNHNEERIRIDLTWTLRNISKKCMYIYIYRIYHIQILYKEKFEYIYIHLNILIYIYMHMPEISQI